MLSILCQASSPPRAATFLAITSSAVVAGPLASDAARAPGSMISPQSASITHARMSTLTGALGRGRRTRRVVGHYGFQLRLTKQGSSSPSLTDTFLMVIL